LINKINQNQHYNIKYVNCSRDMLFEQPFFGTTCEITKIYKEM